MASISSVDLWPEQGFGPADRTPLAVVKEQASLLAKHTGNLVLGEVRAKMENLKVNLVFRIVAPALENYTLSLFELEYPVTTSYPITVGGSTVPTPPKDAIWNEEELQQFLETVFKSDQTKTTIRSLMDHSRLAS